jgi:hypothetical protein
MPFCTKCGKEISQQDSFCRYCGTANPDVVANQTVAQPPPENRPIWVPILAILTIPLIFVLGFLLPRGWNWLFVIVLMVGFIALVGKRITGRFSGVLINERNKMTLSRFQLAVWTLIVLSAFLTIALERVYAGAIDPLAIALPTQLWALLGISTTSLIGSPLILSTKLKKTSKYVKGDQKFGILNYNEKREEAEFSDMFRGDENVNEDSIDMAKVQMFFFTLIIAFSYMILLVNSIMTIDAAQLNSFPELSDGLVALLGISSAGYLTNKAIDHTKT